MASFTGPEIAAHLQVGHLIASHEAFSAKLELQLQRLPAIMRGITGMAHWINGVFVITSVEEAKEQLEEEFDAGSLRMVQKVFGSGNAMKWGGKRWNLVPGGALAGVEPGPPLLAALAELEAPAVLSFKTDEQSVNCGDDHVRAVNINRWAQPLDAEDKAAVVKAFGQVLEKHPECKVKVAHYVGGPCEDDIVTTCLVPGGGGADRGWTVVKDDLAAAIALAHERSLDRDPGGAVHNGMAVELTGLRSAQHLNGARGIALAYVPKKGRFQVRLADGEGKLVKPANLRPEAPASQGQVLAFWGDARWSRAQLLGEIARGHWGLACGSVADIAASMASSAAKSTVFEGVNPRLIFAPESAMTEDFMRNPEEEMARIRRRIEMSRPAAGSVEEEEAEDAEGAEAAEGAEGEAAVAEAAAAEGGEREDGCLLYTSPSPRD